MSRTLGLYAVLGGTVTLVGWTFEIVRLTDWSGDGISMFPNTAVCAVLCGIAIVMLGGRQFKRARSITPRLLAIVVALIGGATLFEHALHINLGIDTLLFAHQWGQRASAAPMRMGLPACSSYLALGVGVFLATRGSYARRIASMLALAVVGIASLSLIGYWYGADQLYIVPKYTGIAWQTSTMLGALGAGLIAAIPEFGVVAILRRDDVGGILARRLLIPIIGIPLLLGWVRIIGQDANLYDTAFGTAVRTIIEIALLGFIVCWTADGLSRQAQIARAAERALRESEQRFRTMADAAPALIWMSGPDRATTWFNTQWLEFVGQPLEAELGEGWTRHIHPEDLASCLDTYITAFSARQRFSMTYRLRRHDGEYRWIRDDGIPRYDVGGGFAGYIGTCMDVTEPKLAEQAAKEADRRKDEFLATLAHELRNPLAPIGNALEIIKHAEGDAEVLHIARDTMERQFGQMVRLVDDLLDVSRITRDKLELRPQPVELASLVQQAVEVSQPWAEVGGHKISVRLPAESIWLCGDPVRLTQALSNLLNNACKFTDVGGVIQVAAQRLGGEVAVTVADNGIGIAPDKLGSIFEMFSQVDKTLERTRSGLGIGLTLVKRLVELHGGRIVAESEGLGRGSRFTIYLPESSDTRAPATRSSPATLDGVAPKRILITDDNEDAARSLAMVLKFNGHQIEVANDGASALRVAEQFQPEIILLDIGLPGMSGYDVCRTIRQQPWGHGVRIVAITGWGQDDDRRAAREAGFDDHLVKPVDHQRLHETIARADS